MASFHLLVLIVFAVLCCAANGENSTLLLVQTLSRHGDRAPSVLYPTDNNTENCWPNGLGELTQLGKKQQFEVGTFLRNLYKDFGVPDVNQISVNCSDSDRCFDSGAAQLVGFYDLHDDGSSNYWQPIPFHYLPPTEDRYLSTAADCPRAKEEYLRQANLTERREPQNVKDTMDELSKLSGFDFYNFIDAYNLFIAIDSEIIHNCTVPDWGYEYYDFLKRAYDKVVTFFYSTADQTKLRYGPFLGLINNNLKNKIDGKSDLKYAFNFAHGEQVEGVLAALNFTGIAHPPFCATILFELHQMPDSSMAVRLRYMNTTYPLNDPENQPVLVLNGCTEFCPVDYFMESYQYLIPDNWEEECSMDISDTSNMSDS